MLYPTVTDTLWQSSINSANKQQDRQYTCIVTLRRFRAIIVAVDKRWILHFLSVFVALVNRYVACPELNYFSTLSRKRHAFPKTFLNTKYVLWLSLQLLSDISHSQKKLTRYDKKTCIGLHIMFPLFLSDFNETLIFSIEFLINPQISNIIKICPVGAEFIIRAGGQTNRHNEANSRISQFCECASDSCQILNDMEIKDCYRRVQVTPKINGLEYEFVNNVKVLNCFKCV
jgi:hypothetical protein